MEKNSVFRNEKALERQEQWYLTFKAKIRCETHHQDLETTLGKSHVLMAGDPNNPPLVCLHSMLTSSAHLIAELQGLSENYYLIAPDIPGQSSRSLPFHLSYKDDSYAEWFKEIMDLLDIQRSSLLGVSLGGFVARQFASKYPERVRDLTLIVPAGIVQGSLIKGFSKMAMPMIRYRIRPNETNLEKLAAHLLTSPDKDWMQYLGDSFMDFKPNMNIPPQATDIELQNLTMPVLTIAAENDISFPGRELIDRMKSQVASLQTELLEGSRHSPPTTPEFRQWLAARIHEFVSE